MCIRDRIFKVIDKFWPGPLTLILRKKEIVPYIVTSGLETCLLYTSDAADERSSVDLGGRRIIKKKNMLVICASILESYTKTS